MKKQNQIRLAIVEWSDHFFVHTDAGEYESWQELIDDIRSTVITYCSAGILVDEDDEKVILANVIPVVGEDAFIPKKSTTTFGCIVKGAIKRMLVIEVNLSDGSKGRVRDAAKSVKISRGEK